MLSSVSTDVPSRRHEVKKLSGLADVRAALTAAEAVETERLEGIRREEEVRAGGGGDSSSWTATGAARNARTRTVWNPN